MDSAFSVNGVPIRLTDERWEHITGNKPYMDAYREEVLEAVARPTLVIAGHAGTLVAVLALARQRYLHVVYREVSRMDGFVITAFIARKLNRRNVIWPERS